MPCIRFLRNYTGKIATTYPCPHPISVRMRNGSYQDARWLGMVCEAAIPHLECLGSVKIKAMDITNGDGIKCEWRSLKKGEHVLGARVECPIGSGYDTAVYGVVDTKGWPIVVGKHGLTRVPKLKIA